MVERMSQAAMHAGIADTRKQVRDGVAKAEAQIAEHWLWYLILGIVLWLAGLAAIAFPFLSTIAAKIALGWIFLVSGVVTIAHALRDRRRISRIPSFRGHPDTDDPGGRAVSDGWSPGSDHGI